MIGVLDHHFDRGFCPPRINLRAQASNCSRVSGRRQPRFSLIAEVRHPTPDGAYRYAELSSLGFVPLHEWSVRIELGARLTDGGKVGMTGAVTGKYLSDMRRAEAHGPQLDLGQLGKNHTRRITGTLGIANFVDQACTTTIQEFAQRNSLCALTARSKTNRELKP